MDKFDGVKVYTFKFKGENLQVFSRCIDDDIHYKVFGDFFTMFGRLPLQSFSSFVLFKRAIRKLVFQFKSECNE